MRTIEKNVYEFNELSNAAKEKARGICRDTNLSDGWYDFIIADAKKVASILGIFIKEIHFSWLSSSRGVRFSGSYRYAKGGLKKIKEHAPLDTALHDIARDLHKIQAVNFYQVQASITKAGHYSHSGTMRLDAWREDGKDFNSEDDLLTVMRNFADWIYSSLRSEYDWITSNEVIDEFIDASELMFYEDGSIYHG